MPVLIALICGVALRFFFVFSTPIGGSSVPGKLSSYNDELAHANYVLYLLEHYALPTQIEAIQQDGALQRAVYENYQPPLYYMMTAVLAGVFDSKSLNHIVILGRLLNLLLLVGIVLVYVRLCSYLPIAPLAIGAGLIFISLGGVWVRFGSSLGNDPLFWLFGGIVVLFLLRMNRDKSDRKTIILVVLTIALTLYIKLTGLLLLPLLFAYERKQRLEMREMLIRVFILSAVIVLTLPIWLRNVQYFGGILPLSAGFGVPHWHWPGVDVLTYGVRSFVLPWSEFWKGVVGLLLILPPLVYFIIGIARKSSVEHIKIPMLLMLLMVVLLGYLWLNCRYDQAEGRYLYAAWPVIALLISSPITNRAKQWIFLVVWSLPYSLFFIPVGVSGA